MSQPKTLVTGDGPVIVFAVITVAGVGRGGAAHVGSTQKGTCLGTGNLFLFLFQRDHFGGIWLAQSGEQVTLNLVSSSPMSAMKMT